MNAARPANVLCAGDTFGRSCTASSIVLQLQVKLAGEHTIGTTRLCAADIDGRKVRMCDQCQYKTVRQRVDTHE